MKVFFLVYSFLISFSVIAQPSLQPVPPYTWTWMNGNKTVGGIGYYGARTVPSASNKIPARNSSSSWTDDQGNFWLFGGGAAGMLNDLWKYESSAGIWTWMKGDSIQDKLGKYYIQGFGDSLNKPGGRVGITATKDKYGNLWMFGGYGFGGTGGAGWLSDVWQYNISTDEWIWMQGDTIVNTFGSYGSIGVAGSGTGPGAREGAVMWTDPSNNLWMFGGSGFAKSTFGGLNDLWKYNPASSEWTWIKGDSVANQAGIFLTKGIPNAGSNPPPLYRPAYWNDSKGNFWLYGGSDASGNCYNDVWKYNISGNIWTWIRGDGTGNQKAIYGNLGVPAAGSKPGSRDSQGSWMDNNGNLLMFGGHGWGTTTLSFLNDLWKLDTTTKIWTWVAGDSSDGSHFGIYGVKGIPSISNKPGTRYGPVSFKDNTGNLWMMTGNGESEASSGVLDDIWKVNTQPTYTFIGNGDWYTPSNWINNAVPSNTISSTVIVEINPSGQCNLTTGLSILVGGTLNIFAGKSLNMINGNFNNAGLVTGPGKITFSGINTATLSSSGNINAPIALTAKQMALSGNANTKDIQLTGGSHISLGNFTLSMDTGTLYGDNLNYVITNGTGFLKKFARMTESVYHIGISTTSYTPVTIYNYGTNSPVSITDYGTGDTVSLRVVQGIKSRAGVSTITTGSVDRSWIVEGWTDNWNMELAVQWNASDQQSGFEKNRCYLAKVCPLPNYCVQGFEELDPVTAAGSDPYTILRHMSTFNIKDTFIIRSIARGIINPYSPWTWVSGDSVRNQFSKYGTITTPSSINKPSSRNASASWIDSSGRMWIFGGKGYASVTNGVTNPSTLNDLWRYDPRTDEWTWMKGDTTTYNEAFYRDSLVASDNSKPGGRYEPMQWRDTSGNLWLFGGNGFTHGVTKGYLSDVWKFVTSTNQWTWMQGDTILNTFGSYGTLGSTGSGTGPGARQNGVTWVDAQNKFWLFGGYGYARSNIGFLNDLWKYDPSTNLWTWVTGDSTANKVAIYGSQGIASATNKPGGLRGAVTWIDAAGKLWMFGGNKDSTYNHLWKYDPGTNQWTWMRGNGLLKGNYGIMGVASNSSMPGARSGAVSWSDNAGKFWLFGGAGFDTTDYIDPGPLNDLWMYDQLSNQWTFEKGNMSVQQKGVYGSKGYPNNFNKPGSRYSAMAWKDSSGSFWLFGGEGYGKSGFVGSLNDLWRIGPTTYRFTGDGDWYTSYNWVNNMIAPDTITSNMIVIIDPYGQCNHTGSIVIQKFGTLAIRPGKVLTIINGGLTNAGYLNGPGKVLFTGGTSASLSSIGFITAPLSLLSKEMFLTTNTTTQAIELLGGSHIRLDGFNLDMDTATLTANSSNYIITNSTGMLKRFVSAAAKLFAIGINDVAYTPATVSNSGATIPNGTQGTGPGDAISLRVAEKVLIRPGQDSITIGAVDRTWVIGEGIPGGSNLDLTLQWNTLEHQPGFDKNLCAISKICPPPTGCVHNYEDITSSTSNGTNPFFITRSNITTFNTPDSFIVRSNPIKFTFTGSGNWDNPANWTANLIPSTPIKPGWEVTINPITGPCIFTGNLVIERGGAVIVQPGKILTVTGNLIQQ